jgi:predicted ATPase/class 3 adenylate cyclase
VGVFGSLDSALAAEHIGGVRSQPTGTVTLLFSDIEGSTRLLQQLGRDRYAEALDLHRRLLREAFERHGGYEVDCEGDAFFIAFGRAEDAAIAASEAQQALAAAGWPDERELRVRMGIHTGEPLVVPPKYVGLDVHRAARIMAAGHGGQVLLSRVTRELVAEGVQVKDLGEHRLKDLTAPQRLYQLLVEGLPSEFPAPKSLDHTNLPIAASALVGRETELRQLVDLLRNGARLVTLTGAGGSGKTRLALQAAGELVASYDDVWFVSLAALSDPELVLPTVAQTVAGSGDLYETLRGKRTLLLLDNFEHLLEASVTVGKLLAAAEGVRILATSRSPLRIGFEHEVLLDPLPDADAAALFVERARAAGGVLELDEVVVEICRRVDRLPLAIELAAARAKLLDPPALLARLDQRLPLLTGGRRDAPERQRTLRQTIDWSHELLGRELQGVFRRLAVFAGGFTLEAAEAVCEASVDKLAELVDASLLKPLGTGRFLMLETIREYGLDKLREAGETDLLRADHATYFRGLAEEAEPHLLGEAEPHLVMGGQALAIWVRRLEEDVDNLRLALAFFRESGDTPQELRLATASWEFWRLHGYVTEGRRYLEHALEAGVPADQRVFDALWGAAYLAYCDGDFADAKRWAAELLELAERLGDDLAAARAVYMSSLLAESDDECMALQQQALELAGDHPYARYMTDALGLMALTRHDLPEARRYLELSREISESIGDAITRWTVLVNLANVALAEGDDRSAAGLLREAARNAREIGDVATGSWARFWTAVAATYMKRGLPEHALRVLGAAERLREETKTAPLGGFTLRLHEQVLAEIQDSVGRDQAAEAWEQGRAQASEEFLEQALRDLD